MTQLVNIEAAQKSLKECFAKRMAELATQLQCTNVSKDAVATVAEQFQIFRQLTYE